MLLQLGVHPIRREREGIVTDADTNLSIIRRHHDALNRGDIAAAVTDYAEDCTNHGRPAGRQRIEAILRDIHTTFPDDKAEILDAIGVGDDVVVRAIVSGTHSGVSRLPVMGALLMGVAPTGRSYKVQHIHWYRMKDGQIQDHRANRDDLGMLQQLGILPGLDARGGLNEEGIRQPLAE
ncbi:MAG TPA: ester cyclase [Acidimicrobiales bacterium]|nr:ester cyclase [Acidimicrobiales bacterium]